MTPNNKKAPQGEALKRLGGPIRTSPSVAVGPDTRVVRTLSLPNTDGEIEAGKIRADVMAPAGSVVVLNVGDGNRMDRFTARIVGKALALCSMIQIEGESFGPSYSTVHYFYGLEAITHGIRQAAAEEAEDLRDWEVTA
ncbi:hypothetical protein ACIRL0_06600 [Streptomyces sp. NPDC102365]|uniref:hypothetical protein n=1 Tax=Streptomyces sp. NPDC102365 TaxID=3366162 RepID=UPI0038017F0A